MHYKIVVTLLVLTLVYHVYSDSNEIYDDEEKPTKANAWKFKDYIQKFRPKTIWDNIDKRRKLNGENLTMHKHFETMMEGIDQTDELMRLRVGDIITSIVSDDTRKRFRPTGNLTQHKQDPFELRHRIFELMKHAIYQARNRMVLMQTMRAKHKDSSLYKMGFLFSKTDTTVKTFGKTAYRAFKACTEARQGRMKHFALINVMLAEERVLDLWFDVDLLSDLIIVNDENLKSLYETIRNPKMLNQAWKFVDKK